MPRIFISYRKSVSKKDARSLYTELKQFYDEKEIFLDIESIPLGEKFEIFIPDKLSECDVFLLLITEGTFDRINDKEDWVRKEISIICKKEKTLIIPIIIDNTTIPDPRNLPIDVKPILEHNLAFIHDNVYKLCVQQIVDRINEYHPSSLPVANKTPLSTKKPILYKDIQNIFKAKARDEALQKQDLFGDAGKLATDGTWQINPRNARGHGVYGPYIELLEGKYKAIFRIKIDDNNPLDNYIFTIDVTRNIGNDILIKKRIYAQDFQYNDEYQDFILDFELKEISRNVEFRLGTERQKIPDRNINLKFIMLAHQEPI